MNTAFLQGFNPVISVSLAAILILVALAVSWWSYAYLTRISTLKKYTLVLLRAAALLTLIFLLLNPYSISETSSNEHHSIAVYLDNSQSLTVNRGAYSGQESYQAILENLRDELENSFETSYYLFENDISSGGEITLAGSATNLFQVYEHFRENENRYLASIILSDGIITQGRNPQFSVQNLSRPVITIPLGDTTTVRDIAISHIEAPERAYTYTSHNVSIEISQQGFEDAEVEAAIHKDREFFTSGQIRFNAEQSTHVYEFPVEFTEPGLYTFDVSVSELEEEFTHQNNNRSFSIEVIDDKTEILSLAFEIHPDVASVRRLIASDQQNELISSTYLSENQVIGEAPENLNSIPDLVIVHGLPSSALSVLEWLENTTAPILFMALPSTFRNRPWPQHIRPLVPYSTGDGINMIQVQIDSFLSGENHPITDISAAGLQRFPFLVSATSDYTTSSLASVLLHANYEGEPLSLPILIAEETGTRRIAAINAFNWFRFENNRNEETRDFFTTLFTNIISWTASSPDHENLTLEPAKETFNEHEPVQIRAALVNELGAPEPGATIELQIFAQASENPLRTFTMSHEQNGRYISDIGNLPEGSYRAAGVASIENRQLGADQAVFSVGESAIEFLNTQRNDDLLAAMAARSDGIFLHDYDMERIAEFLRQKLEQEAEAGLTTETNYFHRSYLWFVFILALLTAEWLLRRSLSLP